MARLRALKPDEMPEEVRELLGPKALAAEETLGAARVWAQRPDIMAAFHRLKVELAAASMLSPRLRELLRLRIAFHNQCRSCMAIRYDSGVQDGVSEDLVCELAAPDEAPNLTDAERAALRYADLLATNHLAIDDTVFDAMRRHYSEPEIVEICAHCGYCIGMGRVAMSWDLVEDLPERFRDRGAPVTPWGAGARVV